jgi:transposase-like protein
MSCPEIGLHKKCKNMERYSRVSDSKWQSIYSEEFKRFVCNEYLSGSMTKKEVELKHDLGNGRLTYWLRERGFGDLKTRIVSLPDMKSVKNNIIEKGSQKSIAELEKALQESQLLAETYRKIIEVAEKELKISIVKKSNTK